MVYLFVIIAGLQIRPQPRRAHYNPISSLDRILGNDRNGSLLNPDKVNKTLVMNRNILVCISVTRSETTKF